MAKDKGSGGGKWPSTGSKPGKGQGTPSQQQGGSKGGKSPKS